MRTSAPAKLPIFRSRLQADLLALLFMPGEQGLAVKDLAERTAASRSSVQRELARLLDAGILDREESGRTSIYRPADSPVRGPLGELIEVTVGVVPRLTEQLGRLTGIDVAVVYGSWASGPVSPDSDIDLLVIGSVDYPDLLREVAKVEEAVGREIEVRLYQAEEFESRLGEGSGFLRTALSGPTVTLIGELPELPR
jgi:DNA-binding transcriptional ArsR family regulator